MRKVSIQTLTDYHLQDFLYCPQQFFSKYIQQEQQTFEWRQIVQTAVNRVIAAYYRAPIKQRTAFYILKLLEKSWVTVPVKAFESKTHYYTVLAKVTDYLLHYLLADQSQILPLFVYEKLKVYIEELETLLSMTIDIGRWSSGSFIIRKYIVGTTEEVTELFQQLIPVFSYKAFGRLPERIEIICLLEGNKYSYEPKKEQIAQGFSYLKAMKELLLQSGGCQKQCYPLSLH